MDKDGQVECSAPENEENTPVYIPEGWTQPKDRNDGNCEDPTDCVDNQHCRNHPKCDPKCKGDGCNHPDCHNDPRCPDDDERDELGKARNRNLCNPLDPNDTDCDFAPFKNPNSQVRSIMNKSE